MSIDSSRVAGALAMAALLALAGCATRAPAPAPAPPARPTPAPAPQARYVPTDFASLPGWADDDLAGLAQALRRQCRIAPGTKARSATIDATCGTTGAPPIDDPATVRAWIEARFRPWAVAAAEPAMAISAAPLAPAAPRPVETPAAFDGLVTGYYEPLLNGAREAGGTFRTPIRARPDDLLVLDLASVYPDTRGLRLRGRLLATPGAVPRVVPYGSRAELEKQPAAPALAWVDDPVDAFFLEIQGSGRIRLPDGSLLRVGYADQNGHAYRPIGRELLRRGALPAGSATAPAIRDWLRANPAEASAVMATNPSVVFFRELPPPSEPDAGPPGALGVPLTPTRSIAVDPQVLPLGALMYVTTAHPARSGLLARTVLAQDTGGAIRGAVRADFFWGFDAVDGVPAADLAGRMRASGRLWLLWPRGETPPGGVAPAP